MANFFFAPVGPIKFPIIGSLIFGVFTNRFYRSVRIVRLPPRSLSIILIGSFPPQGGCIIIIPFPILIFLSSVIRTHYQKSTIFSVFLVPTLSLIIHVIRRFIGAIITVKRPRSLLFLSITNPSFLFYIARFIPFFKVGCPACRQDKNRE